MLIEAMGKWCNHMHLWNLSLYDQPDDAIKAVESEIGRGLGSVNNLMVEVLEQGEPVSVEVFLLLSSPFRFTHIPTGETFNPLLHFSKWLVRWENFNSTMEETDRKN